MKNNILSYGEQHVKTTLKSPKHGLDNNHYDKYENKNSMYECQSNWVAGIRENKYNWIKNMPPKERKVAVLTLKKKDYKFYSNHCNKRDCPICIDHRIGLVKARLKVCFSNAKLVQHVGLTVPNLTWFSKADKSYYDGKLRLFMKRLNKPYSRLTQRKMCTWCKTTLKNRDGCQGCNLFKERTSLAGVTINDLKQKSSNNFNFHYHQAYFNYSLSHKATTVLWSWINGRRLHTFVKYNRRKKNIINYFAKRVAMAGINLDPIVYDDVIKHSRLFNCFGSLSYFTVLATLRSEIALQRKENQIIPIQTFSRNPKDKKPPPELLDIGVLGKFVLDMIDKEIRFGSGSISVNSGGQRLHTHRNLTEEEAHVVWNGGHVDVPNVTEWR